MYLDAEGRLKDREHGIVALDAAGFCTDRACHTVTISH